LPAIANVSAWTIRIGRATTLAFAGLSFGSKGQKTADGAGRYERAASDPAQELPAGRASRRLFRNFN
jgi:hypothetical protein